MRPTLTVNLTDTFSLEEKGERERVLISHTVLCSYLKYILVQYEFEKYRMEMSEGKKKVWCFNFFVSV